jgi:hypothetical protein
VAYLGEVSTDPLTKKTVPDHQRHGGLQQHPQGGHQEGLQPLPIQAMGKVVAAKGDFIRQM